ncbi:hypothetical protein BGZ65_006057 [Modicella reniformis]|uniref:Ubiquitin n=1 Tax=Modicella reniformis TaxID=1440133 RepID=A0A9P6LSK4_9FUNG|nr:hypothetical protein BGZ65_006057 [Modicella reniformis]
MVATLDVLIAERPGQSIKVPYDDHEPIYFLLQRISLKLHGKIDPYPRQINLYMNGIPLPDREESIARYRIFGNLLTYRSTKAGDMMVYVTLRGKKIAFSCNGSDTLNRLKSMIAQAEFIPVDQQSLSFDGRELQAGKTLKQYHILHGCTVHLAVRLRGGGFAYIPSSVMFSDISDTKSVCKVEFSESAPKGRTTCHGTNIECECECTPDYQVICRKEFGKIELSVDSFKCPNCDGCQNIALVTVGFVECKYRFHGVKATGERHTTEWVEVTKDDCYQYFNPIKTIGWKRLVIESAELCALDKCSICLQPMSNTTSPNPCCGHRFHSTCYAKWNSSCPTCHLNQQLI